MFEMNHLKQITAQLSAYHLDALLLTSEPGEYYATGFHGEGYVLVTPNKCYYSTDSRYIEAAAAVEHVELAMIENGKSHLDLTVEHVVADGIKTLGIEEGYLSVADFDAIRAAMPADVELVPAQKLLTDLRACKDEEELSYMRRAQEITDKAFAEVLQYIKPGVTENEIAARLTYLMMSFGARKNSFDPIVASGPNGSMPHAIPGERKIQSGEFVTMDFGCMYEGYCSDMTRTVCVGQPTEEMVKVYETVLAAQKAGIAVAKAGVPGCDIHNAAHDVIRAAGYGEYFGHGFGHSLGLEIHENPGARPANHDPMPLGCAVSAEPGIYLPGKFGVRIEDVILLTEDGCIDITNSPKNLICL
jgi:Xaa-Pro aminopeptidase